MAIGALLSAATALVFFVITAGMEANDQAAWSWMCFATGCAVVHGGALIGSHRPLWVRIVHVLCLVIWIASIFVVRILLTIAA
jgi:hypothetical protein